MEKRLQNLTCGTIVLPQAQKISVTHAFEVDGFQYKQTTIQSDHCRLIPLMQRHLLDMKFQCTTHGRPSRQALSLGVVCTFACAHLTSRANRDSSRRYGAMPCSDELWRCLYGESHREKCAAGEKTGSLVLEREHVVTPWCSAGKSGPGCEGMGRL